MNEIVLYGTVGRSFWDEECFSAKDVRDQLADMSGPLTVRLNSGGGIATEGQAIYAALTGYPDTVDIVIEGVAASAASLIAMAGDTIIMSAGALMMIHDPAIGWVDGRGTEDDHLKVARTLGVISTAYADIYARRAGITVDAARAIMKAETYYSGADAVAAGFATESDQSGAPIDPVAFDYRLYRHAPDRLRAVGAKMTPPRSDKDILSVEARQKTREVVTMDDATKDIDEEVQPSPDNEAEMKDGDDGDGGDISGGDAGADVGDGGAEATAASAAEVIAVVNMCAQHGAAHRAAEFVNRGMNSRQAYAELTGGENKVRINNNAPRANIIRDERDTRRAGLETAIFARLTRARDVTGPGRDYMDMTLAEMAMAGMGQRGRVARGGGEMRAFEMAYASHSTSDFPAIFENALNKRLARAYTEAQPVYRAIAERIDFADFRPHPIAQIGDWPTLLPVPETGEIQYGTVSDKKESVALVPYARAFRISRQMMVNDDLGGIDRMLNSRGRAVAAFEDATFFAMMLAGANADGPKLMETTRQVFNTTDGTKAAAGAALTPASIASAYAALRKRKGVSGEAYLAVEPRILLVGPDQEFAAMQLLAPIQAAQVGAVNPYAGRLTPVVTPYITGNAWYLFADPQDIPAFMYGYLQGEEGPRMRTDEPFGQQGIAYSVELDFGCGATDYRGTFKNAGA